LGPTFGEKSIWGKVVWGEVSFSIFGKSRFWEKLFWEKVVLGTSVVPRICIALQWRIK
jgi:hypothetical protein